MKTKIVTSIALTLAIFSLIVFQSFTLNEIDSSIQNLSVSGKVFQFGQCPQGVVQSGAQYTVWNITTSQIVGSGTTGVDGSYSTNGIINSGDKIRVEARYLGKIGCYRITMGSKPAYNSNVCISFKGNACPDEE